MNGAPDVMALFHVWATLHKAVKAKDYIFHPYQKR